MKTRICQYGNCKHGGKVDIDTEDFEKDKYGYYHKSCYQEKSDLQLIRQLWVDNINNTVVYSKLSKVLNDFVKNGVSTDYMIFALQYVIAHNFKLSHPPGFKYYIDNAEIKEAYKQKQINNVLKNADFSIKHKNIENDSSPKFFVANKPCGFGGILK